MPDIMNLFKSVSGKGITPDNSEDIVFIIDTNFRYTFCNQAFLNLVGHKDLTNVINRSVRELFTGKELKLVEEKFNNVIKHKKSTSFVIPFEETNSVKIAKMTMFPIIQSGTLKGVLAFSSDITKEEQLKQSLLARISQLNSLIDSMPLLTYMKDKNLNYIFGSKHSEKFVKSGIDPYINGTRIDIDEASEITKMEDSYVLHNKEMLVREKSLKSTDGGEHWYKIYKSPVFDKDKNVSGILSVAQNIDFEKNIDKQKELFVAALTHDLKNPLQAQLTNLKLLLGGTFGKVSSSQKQILDMIIESADFMHEMLYSILSVYKYDSGSVKLEKSRFNLVDLIKKCVKESVNLAAEKHLTINWHSNFSNIQIFADKNQIRRVISNLINNGIQYSVSNTEIHISLEQKCEKVFINVRNTSLPMPEDIKKRIFNKYVSSRQGTGLGLYYCEKVISAHNGKISFTAKSSINNFLIELPAAPVLDGDKDNRVILS